MNTEMLYYSDCHLDSCEAKVLTCTPCDRGWLVVLDRTVFYPEGGGQPCDLGTLGDAQVLDVQESTGTVTHLCDRELTPGTTVTAKIDYLRRRQLMQQHSADHLVSGLIYRQFGFHNVGFHMGAEGVTIDFDGIIPADALAQIEQQANELIWQNLPIRSWYPPEEELPAIPYRSKKALDWPVRLVEIPGIDICACCGVHVASTGEIGVIKILSCVRFHQGVRVLMAAGQGAWEQLRSVFEQNRQVSQCFSAKPLETGAAAQRAAQALEAEKYRSTGLERRLFDSIAARYAGQSNVLHFEPELDGTGVRTLADKIADGISGTAAVFSGSDGRFSYALVSRTVDLRQLCKDMNGALSGRGGGKPGFQQGSVAADQEAISAFFAQKFAADQKHYSFFCHKDCEYFPCHETTHPEQFNCLFCYCPLYALGDQCGGNFRYLDSGIKSCEDCRLPHSPNGFAYVVGKYAEIAKLAAENRRDLTERQNSV